MKITTLKQNHYVEESQVYSEPLHEAKLIEKSIFRPI